MASYRKQSQKSGELLLDAIIRLIYRVGFRVIVKLRRFGYPKRPGVAVVIWFGGKVLAVQHSYIQDWGLPGGSIDTGEEPKQAAVREMKEELGLDLNADDLLRCGNLKNTEVFRIDLTTAPNIQVDNREIVEAFFIDPEELIARVSRYADILRTPTKPS
ncbi:MAG: NUDIX domain-containing protein [Alphaproteobacteria bacterium]|nr:NUDIX domain-containing protein [Alphaproteobacteria bacterium]